MKVLIVVTNVEVYRPGTRPTGLWLSELTHFVDEVIKAGITVDVVSPQGGYVPLDPHSMGFMDDVDRDYYADTDFRQRALADTLRPDQVQAADYDAIYYTGGHGTMWDFPENKDLAAIAQAIYEKGGVVSAVCHGVVGLLPIQDAAGHALIDGKKVTGFTNQEESLNGTTELVPYLTEDAIRDKGAEVETAQAFTPHVVRDGRLFTGQNPQSARALAQAVVAYFKEEGKI